MTNPGFPPGQGGPGHRSRRRRRRRTGCAGSPQRCRLAGSCPRGFRDTERPRLRNRVGVIQCAVPQKLKQLSCQLQMVPAAGYWGGRHDTAGVTQNKRRVRTQEADCEDTRHDAKDAPAGQATAATAGAAARPRVSGRGGSPGVGRAATRIVMCPTTASGSDTALSHKTHLVWATWCCRAGLLLVGCADACMQWSASRAAEAVMGL